LFSAAETLRKQFSSRPEFSTYKDQIKIDITEEGLRIQILDKAERVSFSSGSVDLTPEARLILNEISRGICELPNQIFVGGHTDRRLFAPGSIYTNWELSTDRANAARRELEAGCVKPELIRRIVGYADTQLFVPEDPYAASNRRISIVVLRSSNDAPKDDESEKASSPADSHSNNSDTGNLNSRTPSKGEPAKNASARIDSAHPSPSADAQPSPGSSSEARAAQSQLTKQGSVSVGVPDAIPANAARSREFKPSRTPVAPQH
jgi:chemotaxis protein MotB